jgi:hypothetical protein
MAYFAQLDENNLVTQVIAVANEELLINGVEDETKGIMFCKSLLGEETRWVQTSYNSTIRKNYASIGCTFDETLDAFILPKCHNEAIFNETTCKWICNNQIHTTIKQLTESSN